MDGKEKGKTPSVLLDVRLGSHMIRIVKQGYEPYEEQIKVVEGERKKVSASLKVNTLPTQPPVQSKQPRAIIEKSKAKGYLSISSDPSDAEVYLDGNLIGTTPMNSLKLDPGNYRLKVIKGSKIWERNILIFAEGSLQIRAKPE